MHILVDLDMGAVLCPVRNILECSFILVLGGWVLFKPLVVFSFSSLFMGSDEPLGTVSPDAHEKLF